MKTYKRVCDLFKANVCKIRTALTSKAGYLNHIFSVVLKLQCTTLIVNVLAPCSYFLFLDPLYVIANHKKPYILLSDLNFKPNSL